MTPKQNEQLSKDFASGILNSLAERKIISQAEKAAISKENSTTEQKNEPEKSSD